MWGRVVNSQGVLLHLLSTTPCEFTTPTHTQNFPDLVPRDVYKRQEPNLKIHQKIMFEEFNVHEINCF